MEKIKKVSCEVPGCGAKIPAFRMWAVRKRNGVFTKICGACAREARENGVRTDRLDVALARSSFFKAFQKAEVKKDGHATIAVIPEPPLCRCPED